MPGAAPGLEKTDWHLEGRLAPRENGQGGEELAPIGVHSGPRGTLRHLALMGWQQGRESRGRAQRGGGPVGASSGSGDPREWRRPTQALVQWASCPQTPTTKHRVTKGPNFIDSPPIPPPQGPHGKPAEFRGHQTSGPGGPKRLRSCSWSSRSFRTFLRM